MAKNPFGWDYPAGAENDPRAPWNERPDKCPACEEWEDAGLFCTALLCGECDCPVCQGLCKCDYNEIGDHPPYEDD